MLTHAILAGYHDVSVTSPSKFLQELNVFQSPLHSFEVMLADFRGSINATGIQIKAPLVDQVYLKDLKVAEVLFLRPFKIQPYDICPRWNFTIRPQVRSTKIPFLKGGDVYLQASNNCCSVLKNVCGIIIQILILRYLDTLIEPRENGEVLNG